MLRHHLIPQNRDTKKYIAVTCPPVISHLHRINRRLRKHVNIIIQHGYIMMVNKVENVFRAHLYFQ